MRLAVREIVVLAKVALGTHIPRTLEGYWPRRVNPDSLLIPLPHDLHHQCHCRMAVFHAEPAVNPFQMLLHCPGADTEDGADLRIGLALDHPI